MIDHDLRRARRSWRAIARVPLRQLVIAAGAHAIRHLAGEPITADVIEQCRRAAADMFDALADRGVFRFFGIANAAELGRLPITYVVIDEIGSTVIDPFPIVEAILHGAGAADGWRSTSSLTFADLG